MEGNYYLDYHALRSLFFCFQHSNLICICGSLTDKTFHRTISQRKIMLNLDQHTYDFLNIIGNLRKTSYCYSQSISDLPAMFQNVFLHLKYEICFHHGNG